MLKSLSDTCLTFIVDLFNDIQIAAEIPILWKKGLVTLQLKKAPATLLKNYRPITLISCVCKLYTKIQAKPNSDTIIEKDILGEEQQGFRPERSCLDNLSILNTLYGTKAPQEKLHLGSIDLSAAYDTVNRENGENELPKMTD